MVDWPEGVCKPLIGLIQDYEPYPRWTKYCRFLEANSFPYEFYDLHARDWMEKAATLDVILGITSNEPSHLREMREKFFILEKYLHKKCFPSFEHIFLYENKSLETWIAKAGGIPFAPTHIYNRESDALQALKTLRFPLVSKIDPASGSMGVEWVGNPPKARRIIRQSFSAGGRPTHLLYMRQKNYVYFQDYIPNDGFDMRVIVIGDMVFGYYRKVLKGDFRASGMDLVEKRALPLEAMQIARKLYRIIHSPLLVVDMLHGQDGHYYVIEFSPTCQMKTPEQLHVNGVPGMFLFEDDDTFHFKPCQYWVQGLALREFLRQDGLPAGQKTDVQG